jgi:hypothetical protein
MPSQFNSKRVLDDLEFEWLLCLASTLEFSQRIQPSEAGETQQRWGIPRSKRQNLFESASKKPFDLTRKEM